MWDLDAERAVGKTKLLQSWFDETLAFPHEILNRWNGILVTKKQIRSAIADIRQADGVAGVTAASPSEGWAHACTP